MTASESSAADSSPCPAPSREQLVHLLYEAAELEHNLMCTYLYAVFSLRDGEAEGLSPEQAAATARWRKTILQVSVEEMSHLTAVWNITTALGGSPRFGRDNFPLDPGALPAGIVVKLAPFSDDVLQHFVHLERPEGSAEPDGQGFTPELSFTRAVSAPRITPMPLDYDTVGTFYYTLSRKLRAFVELHGQEAAFCGDPLLQLSESEVALAGARPVICLKTALAAFNTIVEQGEGAPLHSEGSHFRKFHEIRRELGELMLKDAEFSPAFPAAVNPVLRRPMRAGGRIWLEDEVAAATVDLANTGYALMLRLMAYSYLVPRPAPAKAFSIDLALGLMRAVTLLGERAARLPAGPSHPGCHAGMSFTALRDAAPLPPGPAARRFFSERLTEMAQAAERLDEHGDLRTRGAARILADLAGRAERDFESSPSLLPPAVASPPALAAQPSSRTTGERQPAAAAGAKRTLPLSPPVPTTVNGTDEIEAERLTLLYEGKRCIHARFCVTGAPSVFLANVQGPWIVPDAVEAETLFEIAHACPSGAIRYRRKDGGADETAPPVNLLSVRESGPYAVRGELRIDGKSPEFRTTLCRCGASKNKPYCDGSHHEVAFAATGEPATSKADMLEVRNGPLFIDPELDGPLKLRGNLEITSGTGRVVARLQQARLCRCGGSSNKPYCDGTHARIGFKSS